MIDRKSTAALAGLVVLGLALRVYETFKVPPLPADALTNWISIILGLAVVPIVYLIAHKLTEHQHASLFSAALATTIPLFGWKVVSQLTHTIALLLFLLSILALMYIKELGDYWRALVFLPIIFAFVHVYALLLLPIFLLYFLFVKLEQKNFSKDEITFSIVSAICIAAIASFFTLTPAFLAVVQRYVSLNYYSLSTEAFTITKAFAFAGLIPTYLGAFGTYLGLKEKKKSTMLAVAAGATLLVGISTNIIPVLLGLPYFSLVLASLAGFFYKGLDKKVETLRIKDYRTIIELLAFAIVLFAGAVHFLSL